MGIVNISIKSGAKSSCWPLATGRLRGRAAGCALILFAWIVAASAADKCVLGVQPILSAQQTKKAFQPLADYLGKAISKKCVVRTSPNFLAYWDYIRKGGVFDLVLDAAHFTDYRAEKQGYEILAKVPDTVSYSLIVSDQNPVFDASELTAKRIATLGIPSIGAARLNALFPNPARQPLTIEIESTELGFQLLLAGKVAAAILPTPLVSQQMAQGAALPWYSPPNPSRTSPCPPRHRSRPRPAIKCAGPCSRPKKRRRAARCSRPSASSVSNPPRPPPTPGNPRP